MAEAIPVVLFRSVEGSMTSDDGQTVYLRATEPDGQDVMIGLASLNFATASELSN